MVSGEYPEPPRVDGHRRVQPEFGAEVCDDSRRQVRIRRLEPRVVGGGHKAVPLDEGVVALQEGGILRARRQPRRIHAAQELDRVVTGEVPECLVHFAK